MRHLDGRLLVLLLVASGCADNAFLEVALTVPAAACGASEVAFEGRFLEDDEASCPAVAWGGERVSIDVADSFSDVIDVEASGDDVGRDLCLRLLYCAGGCADHDVAVDPSVTVQLDRPFVVGRRTAWSFEPDGACEAGARRPIVPRCEVAGACE